MYSLTDSEGQSPDRQGLQTTLQTCFGWALDGDGWAFGWEWMGVSGQPKRFWMGYRWGFGWAFPADGVVPSSAPEFFESRWPARKTACDPRQARPFLKQKSGIETMRPYHWFSYMGSWRASSSVCSCQFFSIRCKYHPKLHSCDYIPSNCRR